MNHHRLALCGLFVLLFGSFAHAVPAPAPKVREWNLLVFLNGVNNLDYFGTMNLNQMEEVGSNDRVNILVQWGSLGRKSVDRLRVIKDDNPRQVTSPVVQSLGAVDMGDKNQLVDFARWAHKNYPARHTMIAVWNHGSGWHRAESAAGIKDISYDDRTGNVITTEQLGDAMREIAGIMGRKVDIYASDACLMGMIEVADQMAGAVDIFVGSQDLEPGEGWPYETFLKSWNATPNMSAADVGRLLSRRFLEAYQPGGVYGENSVTMSVFDMSKLAPLRSAMSQLSADLIAQPTGVKSSLKQAADRTKYFFGTDYKDLIDFLDQGKIDVLAPVSSAMVRAAHRDFVIANDQNQDNKTFGMSIWLPEAPEDFTFYWPRYQGLSFQRQTNWGEFVRQLMTP